MQQRSGQIYLQAKRGVLRHRQTRQDHPRPHLVARQRRTSAEGSAERWRTQPSNLDWARFLGPVKWRDWDPQQYWNFRAYLDFGGGQVTDLFTHWIDVVHMFMGQDNPISASRRRRRLSLQGRPHRARYHQRPARIPKRMDGHL